MAVSRWWRNVVKGCVLVGAVAWPALGGSGDVPVGSGAILKIKPPLPVWPADYETVGQRRPEFRFNGRYEANRYRIELARNAEFTSPLVLSKTRVVDRSGITPVVVAAYGGEPLEEGRYHWRVFAGDDEGFWTPAANYRTFFISAEKADPIAAVPVDIGHPRLLLSYAEREFFQRRLARSMRLAAGWQYLRNAAYSMLDVDAPGEDYARGGKGQHGNYSTAATWYHRHLGNVAFVAFVTGDERLAAKGVEMLMSACAYRRWLGPLFDDPEHFDPPWNSALETAMMTTAVATAYDLLHPYLSEQQRERVRSSLVEKGVLPLVRDWVDPVTAARLPRHQLSTGNWAMVCTGSAGVGALVLVGEHPEAEQWVRLSRDRVRAWLKDRGGDWYVDNPWPHNRPAPIPVIGPSEPNFGTDGGYKESITYMNYAMMYVCCFADGLHRATREDLFEYVPDNLLQQTAWNSLAWSEQGAVRQAIVPFGDCGTAATFPLLYAALTRHRRDGLAAWLAERVVPIPQDPRVLVWLDEGVAGFQPDTSVPMRVFRDVGQVVMRSGWGPGTPAAAIKFKQNRGHLDIGNFYLFGRGHPSLIDSGPSPYGSPVYSSYSSQSLAHNLVLLDNRPQVRANGELLAAVGTSRLTAASGQLSAAYPDALTSWTRDLVMLPGGLAVVLDRLSADQPHRFDLVLHPYWPFRIPYPIASPGEIFVGGDKPSRIRVNSEAEFTVSEREGYFGTTPRKYVRFDSPEPARQRTYLVTCEWPSRASTFPERIDVTAIGRGRWQIRQVEENSRLIVRTGSEATARDSLDARLVAVWDQGERSRERHALVLAGRRLGVDKRELMRATRPVYAALEFGRPLWAHFWAAEPTRLSLAVEPGADNLFLDGQPLDGVRRGSMISFDLPVGESRLVAGDVPRFIPRPRSVVCDDLLAVRPSLDAPAYQPGVLARSSSCLPEALLVLDDNPGTSWSALPGVALPQWIEVALPAPVPISQVRIETGSACAGDIELWDSRSDGDVTTAPFQTRQDGAAVVIPLGRTQANRIRITIEQLAGGAASASISTLEWNDNDR